MMTIDDKGADGTRIYVLGGNASTLAFVASLRADNRQVTAWLVPLAWTPMGVVIGEGWQRVNIAADNVPGWVDQTFAPDDERAFVASMRDLELLLRIGWHGSEVPEAITEAMVLNADDLPDDIVDGFAHPPEVLAPCSICRRSCVRDHFVWNERRLCAWDYHASVFGKRGPWHDAPYEERHFETLPRAKYIAHGLLDEAGVEAILAVEGLPEPVARELVNIAIERDAGFPHLAVRTDGGITVLRERGVPGEGR